MHTVSQTGTAYLGQAQRIENKYGVSRTTTSQWGQAQRIKDRHSISRRTKTKNPIIPCQRDKTWRSGGWVHSKCFPKREYICSYTFWLLFKLKTKERFVPTADISLVGTLCRTQRQGYSGFQLTWLIEGFFRVWNFWFQDFFGKYFFG